MTAVAVEYIATKRLARLYPYLSQRQIENVLHADGITGVRGKGVPLYPALKALFENAYLQGQKDSPQTPSAIADASYKKARARREQLSYEQKRKNVISLDVMYRWTDKVQATLAEMLTGTAARMAVVLAGHAFVNEDLTRMFKEENRFILAGLEKVFKDIEEEYPRRRDKADTLLEGADETLRAADRIIDAIRQADDLEAVHAFVERELVGTG